MAKLVEITLRGVAKFRRAGIEFNADNTPYRLDLETLTPAQRSELLNTPALKITGSGIPETGGDLQGAAPDDAEAYRRAAAGIGADVKLTGNRDPETARRAGIEAASVRALDEPPAGDRAPHGDRKVGISPQHSDMPPPADKGGKR